MEKLYSRYPSKLYNLFAKFKGANIILVVSRNSALEKEHVDKLSKCLGHNCVLPDPINNMDGVYYKYTWYLTVSDITIFKERLDIFRKKYKKISAHIIITNSLSKKIQILISTLGILCSVLSFVIAIILFNPTNK